MNLITNLSLGVAHQVSTYEGRHRSMNMAKGIGYFPMGDRQRAKPEYGFEERDSVDRYTKYHS